MTTGSHSTSCVAAKRAAGAARVLAVALAWLTLVLVFSACGDDDRPTPSAEERAPLPRLRDVGNALEGAGLALVRDSDATIAAKVEPRPVDSARYAARSGPEFDVLVFADAAQARRAREDVAQTDLVSRGGSYTSAGNVIAAMPEPPGDGAYRVAWQTFRRLARKAGGPRQTGVAPSEVAAHPEGYRGEQLAVTGGVVRLLPAGSERPLAFTIRGAGTRELLVVPRRGVAIPPTLTGAADTGPRPRARVTGEATRMRTEGGPTVPHEDGALAYLGGDPVLLASSVRPLG